MSAFIDLSHAIEHGMTTYHPLPGPLIEDYLGRDDSRTRYAPGTEFQIGSIQMVANTGTYVDSPFHRFAEGMDLSQLPLSSLANLSGITFRVTPDAGAITPDIFSTHELRGRAVLIHSGWSRFWRTDEYHSGRHPYLTDSAAEFLVEARVALVGIDSYNIDDTKGGARPAHTRLLQAEIPIVEHLCGLEDLPDDGYHFFAVPPPVKGMGSFPVRAFALIN
ncbi:MAG: cyclase family protein [Pyrinomonadaceae bacterium]